MYNPLTFREAIHLDERLCGQWVRHLQVRAVYTLLLFTLGLFSKRSVMRCSLDPPLLRSRSFCYTYAPVLTISPPLSIAVCSHCLSRVCLLLFQHPDYVTTTLCGNHNVLNIPQLSCTFAGSVIRSYKRWRLLVFPCASVSCIKVHACLLPTQFSLVLDVTSFYCSPSHLLAACRIFTALCSPAMPSLFSCFSRRVPPLHANRCGPTLSDHNVA